MEFNLENSGALKQTYTRKGGGGREQNFQMKYRKTESNHYFELSKKMWETLGLENNDLAVAVLVNRDDEGKATNIALEIVSADHEDGKFYKKSKRGEKHPKFTSDVVETDFNDAGIIDSSELGNQFIALDKLAGTDREVYVLSIDEEAGKTESKDVEGADETEEEVEEAEL